MSVTASQRTKSKIEVVYQASKVEDALTNLAMRSFGIKSRNSPLRRKYEMVARLEGNTDRIDTVIDRWTDEILECARDANDYVHQANSIFPRLKVECSLRLEYQNKALAACQRAKAKLNSIVRMFNVSVSVFREPTKILDNEIHLIKEWRQKDRKRFQGLPL